MKLVKVILHIIILSLLSISAEERFQSDYPCHDTEKVCIEEGGTKVIDGMEVYRDCWQWRYEKKCEYPSKDDCKLYDHCYWVANRDCLLEDYQGNCVNRKKEFSCERWDPIQIEHKQYETKFDKKKTTRLKCTGIDCMDGNCVDQSYMTDGDMAESLSYLEMLKGMKPDTKFGVSLFPGKQSICKKKIANYINCCSLKGWGPSVTGTECKEEERKLAEDRRNNLCIYVGSKTKKKAKIPYMKKRYFCCFPRLLDKIVQIQGRKQIGKSFGSGDSPDCSGLSLQEITGVDANGNKVGPGIDFSKIDFSEWINATKADYMDKAKSSQSKFNDMQMRLNAQLDGTEQNMTPCSSSCFDFEGPDKEDFAGYSPKDLGSNKDNSYYMEESTEYEAEENVEILDDEKVENFEHKVEHDD